MAAAAVAARRARRAIIVLACAALTGCFSSPPQIISLNPSRGADNVAADTPVMVTFDHPIRFSSLAGRFAVQPSIVGCDVGAAFNAVAGAPCSLRPLPGRNGFRFDHSSAIFAAGTRYSFSVAGGVADEAGVANSLDHQWDITVAAAPSIRVLDPPDGSRTVALDSALAIGFSRPMREASTIGAISLEPPVDGTVVRRNGRDHSRFVVYPGRLLEPGAAYQLVVSTRATDEHGQTLDAASSSRFTAGGLSGGDRGVALLARPGEAPSIVRLTALEPLQAGEPVPAVDVLRADRCPAPSCGELAGGAPFTAYHTAALSPDGTRLAVVETDASAPGAAPSLRVLDLVRRHSPIILPGADLPSWSPDGRLLAYAESGELHFLASGDGRITRLAAGAPAVAPVVWSPDGDLLAEPTAPAGGGRVELGSALLGTRFGLPGLSAASNPAFSPSGRLVAVRHPSPGLGTDAATRTPSSVIVVDLAAGGAPPQSLRGDLTPLAFTDEGTLLATEARPGDAGTRLVRVDLAAGDATLVETGAGARPSTISVAGSRRKLAFLAADAGGVFQIVVETPRGTDRRTITDFARGDIAAAGVSLH